MVAPKNVDVIDFVGCGLLAVEKEQHSRWLRAASRSQPYVRGLRAASRREPHLHGLRAASHRNGRVRDLRDHCADIVERQGGASKALAQKLAPATRDRRCIRTVQTGWIQNEG